MRFRWFFLLLVVVGIQAQELTLFAPAVRFTGVLWWGPSSGGLMTPESREPAARFKTSRKAEYHDGGESR